MLKEVHDFYDMLGSKGHGNDYEPENSFGGILGSPAEYAVMQFTGLKDCNGVEIYESDVIELSGVTYSVEWNVNGHWHYRRVHDMSVYGTAFAVWESEVIGNIYEHPHLLDRPSESP